MKPHINFWRGRWWCGLPGTGRLWWSSASRPCEALRLWMQSRFWRDQSMEASE